MHDDLFTPPGPRHAVPCSARFYVGERGPGGCRVWAVREQGPEPLTTRAAAPSWSFTWGRFGTSARALAWALIHDVSGDERLADDWCGDLCAEVVSQLPREAFSLAASDLLVWLDATVPDPRAAASA